MADWPRELVQSHKGTQRVSVLIPARDEEPTVGLIVTAIRRALMTGPDPLVDELLVIDSDSTDATARAPRRQSRWAGVGRLPRRA